MFCQYCGAQNPDQSLFCSTCGKRIDEPPVPAEQLVPEREPAQEMTEPAQEMTEPAQEMTEPVPVSAETASETPAFIPENTQSQQITEKKKRFNAKLWIPILAICLAAGVIGGILLMQHFNRIDDTQKKANLYYVVEDGKIRIVGFENDGEATMDQDSDVWAAYKRMGLHRFEIDDPSHIVLPEEIDGQPVLEIEKGALDSETIGTVEIPPAVEYPDDAFHPDTEIVIAAPSAPAPSVAPPSSETPQTDAPATDAPVQPGESTAPPETDAPEQIHLGAQYLEILDEYERQYGPLRLVKTYETWENVIGLNWARLIDFDGDGTMELMLSYGVEDAEVGQGVRIDTAVFAEHGGAAGLIYEGTAEVSPQWGGSSVDLVSNGEKTMLKVPVEGELDYNWAFLALEDGTFVPVGEAGENEMTFEGEFSFVVNGTYYETYVEYDQALQDIYTEVESIEYSYGSSSGDQLRYELGKTRDELCMQEGRDSGRDSYDEILRTLMDLNAIGIGRRYDADGDGSDELFLTFYLGEQRVKYGAIYTQKDGRAVPILYERPLCVLAGAATGSVGVVRDGDRFCYAIYGSNGTEDIFGGRSTEHWKLLSLEDGSLILDAQFVRQFEVPEDVDAFWAAYGTDDEMELGYTDSASFNGVPVSPEAYAAWDKSLSTLMMVEPSGEFRGIVSDKTPLEELLSESAH